MDHSSPVDSLWPWAVHSLTYYYTVGKDLIGRVPCLLALWFAIAKPRQADQPLLYKNCWTTRASALSFVFITHMLVNDAPSHNIPPISLVQSYLKLLPVSNSPKTKILRAVFGLFLLLQQHLATYWFESSSLHCYQSVVKVFGSGCGWTNGSVLENAV